jgi:hypothetical protein
MSVFRNFLKTCNVLNIINSKISRGHLETYIEYIANIDKDVILLPIDNS